MTNGEWTPEIRKEIQELALTEISCLEQRKKEIDVMVEKHQSFLAAEQLRIAPDAEELLSRHAETLQNVTDQFEIACLKAA